MRISKLPKQMNNPDEAPLYPNSPDYTNSGTALVGKHTAKEKGEMGPRSGVRAPCPQPSLRVGTSTREEEVKQRVTRT